MLPGYFTDDLIVGIDSKVELNSLIFGKVWVLVRVKVLIPDPKTGIVVKIPKPFTR